MMNFLLALYSSLLIKILPLLVVSLLLTFLLIKAKMPKFFYLLIVVEVIAISVLHYSTVVTSISLYMEERVWIILFNMAILVGIYLMIPIHYVSHIQLDIVLLERGVIHFFEFIITVIAGVLTYYICKQLDEFFKR